MGRLPIIDKFKDLGTVVMGKVESGSIREGDSMLIMPNKVLYPFSWSFVNIHLWPVTSLKEFCRLSSKFIFRSRLKFLPFSVMKIESGLHVLVKTCESGYLGSRKRISYPVLFYLAYVRVYSFIFNMGSYSLFCSALL